MQEEFENTKFAIRIGISKKNRQHNGQKKKYKRKNNDQQNIHMQRYPPRRNVLALMFTSLTVLACLFSVDC